jgi:hypothetical protein
MAPSIPVWYRIPSRPRAKKVQIPSTYTIPQLLQWIREVEQDQDLDCVLHDGIPAALDETVAFFPSHDTPFEVISICQVSVAWTDTFHPF